MQLRLQDMLLLNLGWKCMGGTTEAWHPVLIKGKQSVFSVQDRPWGILQLTLVETTGWEVEDMQRGLVSVEMNGNFSPPSLLIASQDFTPCGYSQLCWCCYWLHLLLLPDWTMQQVLLVWAISDLMCIHTIPATGLNYSLWATALHKSSDNTLTCWAQPSSLIFRNSLWS